MTKSCTLRLYSLALVLVFLAYANPVSAGPRSDWELCNSGLNSQKLEACSNIINDKFANDRDRAIAYFNRGIVQVEQVTIDRLLEANDAIIKSNPRLSRATEGYDLAIKDFSESFKLDPSNVGALLNRGIIYARIGKPLSAIDDFSEVIRFNPKYIEAYKGRSSAYRDTGSYDLSINNATVAIGLDPNNADLYYNRGNAYFGKREYDLAIGDFNKTIQLNPGFENAYVGLARSFDKKGNTAKAIDSYRQLHAVAPGNQEARDALKRLGAPL